MQDDPEIKKCLQINCISTEKDTLEALESRISSWYKMKRVVAMVLRYKKLLKKIQKGESQGELINSSLLKYGVYKYGVLCIGGRFRSRT